ncbi:hypothetical protein KY290_021212 [Solanum tuberosum]|uniref:Uncharacterized protein n=1 Tax=Solanum tuberosum TaxID=4113 RepID=A0ABQ7V2F9_SOLTU|nr:hypothetical protein KY289_020382 [Solanum tuberosum]KAH0693040.1 hypothetical protein KY285_020137 [Solanum tuberosum]KAH0757719.1 hypothetical protein KY290_021212 [Solanum tuberosum]
MKAGKRRNMSGFAGNNGDGGDGLGHETMGRGETIMGRFRRVSRHRLEEERKIVMCAAEMKMGEGESICDFAGKNGDDAGDGFLLVVK